MRTLTLRIKELLVGQMTGDCGLIDDEKTREQLSIDHCTLLTFGCYF
jgi:hypothetical protein